MAAPEEPAADAAGALAVETSPGFTAWLAEQNIGLAFTTYQTSRLFLVGRQPDGQLALTERIFPRAMGLWADGQTLWLSTLYQLWRLENVLGPGERYLEHDRLYAPRMGFVTGAVNVHDVGIDAMGRPIFCATQLNCLAAASPTHNFAPLWRPRFISALVPEDRCHLNGLAMDGGAPRHVTVLSETDMREGWRERKRDGGALIDVGTGESVVRGLSIPHSPRWHEGRLWVLESGAGTIGRADPATGKVERAAFSPGYLRGLAFVGRYAIIGLSKPRRALAFTGLELEASLQRYNLAEQCGIDIVDLQQGRTVHWLRLEGFVNELYDVVVLPGVVRPMAIGFMNEQIQLVLTMEGVASPIQAPSRRNDVPGEGPP